MSIEEELIHKINYKTKPLKSLGKIEEIALKIGMVQGTLSPKLIEPTILVYAADHGITDEGVSAYPKEVTFQMVMNFLSGGAAINVFCKQNDINIKVIDAGVSFDFPASPMLINSKIAKGTQNFLHSPAMSIEQLEQCFEYAEAHINQIAEKGTNIVGFGEMGIGNTSSASMIMSYLCNLRIEQCVGRGTGLNDEGVATKISILKKAKDKHGEINNPKEVLRIFGGFEISQICGAMLAAYKKNMLIMVDGFIATSAFLVASKIEPKILNNAIFCHQSDEQGHKLMLEHLDAKPILSLSLRLGEGTGAALAYPIIKSAVSFINEMASFESAGVSNKE
jgi:nicotinate-nucleotide--dimethylbenzimidazole phosphoribosyltransferase